MRIKNQVDQTRAYGRNDAFSDSERGPRRNYRPREIWKRMYLNYLTEFIPQIKPAGFCVYAMLVKYHNDKTGQCNPSLVTLAKDCQLSKSGVVKAIERLEIAGLIEVRRYKRAKVHKDGQVTTYSTPNEYILKPIEDVLPKIKDVDELSRDLQNWRPGDIGLPEL